MEQIRTIYETNVFGLIRLTQAAIPGMKAKRSGHIISVSSMAGFFGEFWNCFRTNRAKKKKSLRT